MIKRVADIISDATVASETDNEIIMLLPLHTVKLFPTLLRHIETEINEKYVLLVYPWAIGTDTCHLAKLSGLKATASR